MRWKNEDRFIMAKLQLKAVVDFFLLCAILTQEIETSTSPRETSPLPHEPSTPKPETSPSIPETPTSPRETSPPPPEPSTPRHETTPSIPETSTSPRETSPLPHEPSTPKPETSPSVSSTRRPVSTTKSLTTTTGPSTTACQNSTSTSITNITLCLSLPIGQGDIQQLAKFYIVKIQIFKIVIVVIICIDGRPVRVVKVIIIIVITLANGDRWAIRATQEKGQKCRIEVYRCLCIPVNWETISSRTIPDKVMTFKVYMDTVQKLKDSDDCDDSLRKISL